jgi:hypothetical protein
MDELEKIEIVEKLHREGFAVAILDISDSGCSFDEIEAAMINAARFAIEGAEPPDEPDESMDGDHESALASAGFGTDEDYGGIGDDCTAGYDANGSPV